MPAQKSPEHVLYTVGHSNRDLQTFIDLLHAHQIQTLADIRSLPGSRRLPHFNAESLAESLPAAGIDYRPWKSLGGRRKSHADSRNTGWHHPAFRSYADYMETPEFLESLDELLKLAETTRLTVMCAEAVPWRCHRNLVADATVLLHGWEVRHIMTEKLASPHKPMPFAQIEGDHLIYPADDLLAQ